jgi:hypothetical protein
MSTGIEALIVSVPKSQVSLKFQLLRTGGQESSKFEVSLAQSSKTLSQKQNTK